MPLKIDVIYQDLWQELYLYLMRLHAGHSSFASNHNNSVMLEIRGHFGAVAPLRCKIRRFSLFCYCFAIFLAFSLHKNLYCLSDIPVFYSQCVVCTIVEHFSQLSNEKPPNIQLFDPKTPAFWLVLNFELYFLGILTFLGIAWTVLRQLRKRRKVAPPAGKYVLKTFKAFITRPTEALPSQDLRFRQAIARQTLLENFAARLFLPPINPPPPPP